MIESGTIHLADEQLVELMQIAIDPSDGLAAATNHPGLQLAARHGYIAVSQLGEGGLSEVWRGVDSNTGRDVAIKVTKRDVMAGEALLRREADVLSRFHEVGIVGLVRKCLPNYNGNTTITSADQVPLGEEGYLILEFIEGATLEEAARANPRNIIDTFPAICRAVQRVHAIGYVHNDLKPSNIMIRTDGSVALLDFALSTPIGGEPNALSRQGMRGGTHRFLAPELRTGGSGTPSIATDIYSLGATLVWLLHDPAVVSGKRFEVQAARASDDDPARRHTTAIELAIAVAGDNQDARSIFSRKPKPLLTLMLVSTIVAVFMWGLRQGADNGPLITADTNHPRQSHVVTNSTPHALLDAAVTALNDGEPDMASRMLKQVHADDRGWEWQHLWTDATNPPGRNTVVYDTPGVASVFDRESGSAIVATGDDHTVQRVYPSGDVEELMHHPEGIGHVATLPNNEYLVAGAKGRLFVAQGQAIRLQSKVSIQQLTLCWSDANQAVFAWGHPERIIHRLDLMTGKLDQIGTAGFVLLPPSAAGWRLQMSIDEADRDDNAGRTATLIDGSGITRSHFRFDPTEIPMSIDADPASGAAVIGTSTGRMLLFDDPAEPPTVIEATADEGVTAVALAIDEKRVFVAGQELKVFAWPGGELLLTLPIDVPGFVRQIDWNGHASTLTVLTDQGFTQWKAAAHYNLASR